MSFKQLNASSHVHPTQSIKITVSMKHKVFLSKFFEETLSPKKLSYLVAQQQRSSLKTMLSPGKSPRHKEMEDTAAPSMPPNCWPLSLPWFLPGSPLLSHVDPGTLWVLPGFANKLRSLQVKDLPWEPHFLLTVFSAFIYPAQKVVPLQIRGCSMKSPSGFNDPISASYCLEELGFFSTFTFVQTGSRSKR